MVVKILITLAVIVIIVMVAVILLVRKVLREDDQATRDNYDYYL